VFRPIYDLQSLFTRDLEAAQMEGTRMWGPVIGLVTDNKDPNKLGRVKVKVPVLSETDATWWCPIMMFGAGKNRGWFFIPEVDDEVLVAFEHGDVGRPVVLGALWNGEDTPPDNNPGGNPRRMIHSRAGSKITLDDEELKIVIEDGTGKAKITFDSNENKIIIEALEGDACFQAPSDDLQIVAKEVELVAQESLEIHAGSNMQWGSDASVTIQSPNVTLSGSNAKANCGNAQMPEAPTADPQDVPDPYTS
jgi:uncharacterized protein involved in type VI secretion and phage assembly